MSQLKGYQRAHLKGLAHDKKPVVQVGKDGVTDQVVTQVERALLDHELIKVKLTRPEDKKGMAEELAARTASELCGLVGHTVILYKAHPEKPRLKLPEREGA